MRAWPCTLGCSLKYCLLNQCSPLHSSFNWTLRLPVRTFCQKTTDKSSTGTELNQTFQTSLLCHCSASTKSEFWHFSSARTVSHRWMHPVPLQLYFKKNLRFSLDLAISFKIDLQSDLVFLRIMSVQHKANSIHIHPCLWQLITWGECWCLINGNSSKWTPAPQRA